MLSTLLTAPASQFKWTPTSLHPFNVASAEVASETSEIVRTIHLLQKVVIRAHTNKNSEAVTLTCLKVTSQPKATTEGN